MGISPLSIYKKQRYKNIRKTPNLITLFNGKSHFEAILRFKPPRKWRKNEAEMQKSSAPNAVLVKKHNKMIGKKWILNMDFLRI